MTSIDSGVETENDSNESSLQISTCSRSPMKNNVNNDELQIQRFNTVETRSRIEFTYPLISVSSFGSSSNCPEEIETIDTRKRRYLYSSIYTVVKKKEISTLASTSESVLHFASEPLRLSGFERRRPKIITKAYLHKHLEDIGHVTRVRKRVRITTVKKPSLSSYLESPEIQYRRPNMQLAVVTNNTDWLTFSLDKGMKPDFPITDEGYAIHAASSRGFTEMVGILLQYGADPNCRDSSGNTPLHLAAGAIKLPVISLLLQARADVKCLNKDGNRPVDLAQRILNLQSHYTYDDSIVSDVQEIIRILTIHSQRQEENRQQLETLSSSYSQLSVSNNSIPDGVRDLMTTINSLNIKI